MNKNINVSTDTFRSNMTDGLKNAYVAAFNKVNLNFIDKAGRNTPNFADIQINMTSITRTGRTNADNTKDFVNLRYFVLNNNQIVPSDFASDSINLLTGQEMAQYLNQEVDDPGYIETRPRTQETQQDQRLWIIGAVLGPVAFLAIVFWLVAFIYYKCINPRKNKDTKAQSKKLTKESPSSSQENIQQPASAAPTRKGSKVNPVNLVDLEPKKMSSEKADKIDLVEKPGVTKIEVTSKTSPFGENNQAVTKDIENSIRQKTELEKWSKFLLFLGIMAQNLGQVFTHFLFNGA